MIFPPHIFIYNQAPSKQDFNAVEEKLKISLPDSYKKFFLEYNGLLLGDSRYIQIRKGNNLVDIPFWNLWGIDPSNATSTHYLNFFYRNKALKDTLPPDTVSIGFTKDVENILMDNEGKIFLLDGNNMSLTLANSITELIDLIKEYPSFEKVKAKDFKDTEKFIKKSLPKSYINFLLQLDLTKLEKILNKEYFYVKNGQKLGCIFHELYLPNSHASNTNLLDNIKTFKDRIPKEFIPIGSDPGGNQFCLGIEGRDSDKLFFWDHEDESDDEQPYYNNLFPLTSSLKDYYGA